MVEALNTGGHRQELVDVIRKVRSRWRMRLLLRGAIIVLAGGLLALAGASLALQSYKFSPASIVTFRVLVFAAFALLVALWFLRPLGRRVSDLQVALYLEENEPSLQAAILSAVDLGDSAHAADVPPAIIERMIEQAVERCRQIGGGQGVGRRSMLRQAGVLGALAAVTAALLVVGPEFLRQGASALLVLTTSAEEASPYAITVQPGDVEVPKGSDQIIGARLAGFRSNDVLLMIKREGEEAFDRMPLVPGGDATAFEGMLFDLKTSMEYFVEADGVRSPTYTMTVVELPAVAKMQIEYTYPSYTGLSPQIIEDGGDVAALEGTTVRLLITSTMDTPGGALQFDPGDPRTLARQADGTLVGGFTISEDGYYHVQLVGPHGEDVTASPKFTIDALEDGAPSVSFEKPRRDVDASPVEEVFVQARADDDFGIRKLELVYSVNGGEEKIVPLFDGAAGRSLEQVTSGHTLYLEELGVRPGDFVTYFARTLDNNTVDPKDATSDIYFIQVKPFDQDFRAAQSQQGGGGGGGGGGQRDEQGSLSEQQKQIIAATFNVERDRRKSTADKVKEDTVFIGLAQSRLREQVAELTQQITQRLSGDEDARKIAELLPKATEEMEAAEALLKDLKTKEALAPEQRALKYLQEAEQLYDLEVRQGGGGGGGGGGGASASDLADLFQLQLDREANQYELQQSAQEEAADQQVDEMAERLRELARRQLAQAEQLARARGQQGGSGTGSAQRALADEIEEAARQLEELRREAARQGQPRQDLADAARRLNQAATAARQAAANGEAGGGQAQAQEAQRLLQEAQQMLQESQQAQEDPAQGVRNLQNRADQLARQQREVAPRVAQLDRAGDQRANQIQQLTDQKNAMRDETTSIEQGLRQLQRQALADGERDAARQLQVAADSVRQTTLREKIEWSKQTMSTQSQYANDLEKEIGANIDTLRDRIGEAVDAVDRAAQGDGMSEAARQAADLTRGLNTLNEQINQQLGGQQGQQGEGQQGQGEQGQGQQGQGQQGQGQQGQGQQGQGQQGQGQQGQQGQGQQGQGQQGQGQQGQQGQGQQGQGQQGQGQQGQGQQGQGQRGQGGRQGQAGGGGGQRLNDALTGNPSQRASTSGGDARPGLNSGQVRQLQNQARQYAQDAQDLRRQMQEAGAPRGDIQSVDEVLRALRELDGASAKGDPGGLQQLAAAALEKMQKLELDLRRRVDTTSDQLFLSGSEDVPPTYKALIDEYFRSLSKKSGGGGGGR